MNFKNIRKILVDSIRDAHARPPYSLKAAHDYEQEAVRTVLVTDSVYEAQEDYDGPGALIRISDDQFYASYIDLDKLVDLVVTRLCLDPRYRIDE